MSDMRALGRTYQFTLLLRPGRLVRNQHRHGRADRRLSYWRAKPERPSGQTFLDSSDGEWRNAPLRAAWWFEDYVPLDVEDNLYGPWARGVTNRDDWDSYISEHDCSGLDSSTWRVGREGDIRWARNF
jgi:hypothetical protein